MNNYAQATPGRGRFAATSLPTLLLLGALSLWPLARANGQSFVFNPISSRSIGVGTNLSLTLSVTPVPFDGVIFGHGGFVPANSFPTNAFLDSISGAFSWTPNASQLGANNITIWAVETSSLLNSNYTTFTVTVTNAVAPVGGVVIDTILPQTVTEGATLTFTNHAQAIDNPTNALVFSLLNAPAGASMINNTPTSGVFTWTPTAAQAVTSSYTIREIVTEPSASASSFQDFQVRITRTNDCAQLDAFLAAVQQGGYFQLSNCTTIALTNTLTISNNVTLDAGNNSVTIAGNSLSRLFTVLPGVTNFTLRGLTLSGGQDVSGGCLYISQGATVVLTNCTFIGNQAAGADGSAGADGGSSGVNGGNGGNGTGGGTAFGGAIYNLGNLTALNCQFVTNSATGGAGGTSGAGGNALGIGRAGNGGDGGYGGPGDGGAIYSAGNLWLSNCTFTGNGATGGNGAGGGASGTGTGGMPGTGGAGMEGSGAAVYSANYAVIVNCTFSGNIGQGADSATGGTDSAGNGINGQSGGGSLGGGVCNLNTGFLTNCTFFNNQVTGGSGGGGGGAKGIRRGGNGGNGGNGLGGGLYSAGSIVVVNCTFSGCGGASGTNGLAGTGLTSGNNGSMGLGLGGDIAQGSGAFLLQNSILSTNAAGGNAYASTAGGITDGGYNLSSDASPSLSGTSLNNTDPLLSSTLADNGGPTLTLAFLTNTSPAIDKIPPSTGPTTDQRGIPRPQGGLSDIGAYELVTLPAILAQPQSQTIAQGSDATFTVSAFGDSLTYQWRFNGANISGATLSAYTVSGAQATNAGNYDVTVTNNSGSVTSLPAVLTVYPFTISGQVFDPSGISGLNGVTVSAGTNSALTDANGNFTLSGFSTNAYTVTPALACYLFSPASSVTSVGPTNAAGLKFFATNDYHSVSGAIANGPAGVTVTVTGTNGTGTATSSGGIYGVSNLCAGFYYVVPSLPGYQFQPPTNSILVPPDAAGVNFTAVQVFGISGTVAQGTNGSGLGAISVAVSGPITTNVTTSANGVYLVGGLQPGTYVVKPTAPACYHLNLPARTVTLGPNNADGTDFVALRDAYTISGRLTNGVAGVSGITVTAGGTNAVVTDATGLYVLSNLCAGAYTVAPSASCYLFNPTSLSATVGPGNAIGLDFSASPNVHNISGRITEGGIGLGGMSVQAGNQTTNTDSGGNYVFSGLCPGSYTVVPAQGCLLFNPASITVTLGTNATAVDFITYSNNLSRIRGQVTDGVHGLSNVQVTATGGRTNLTDSSGNYVFSSLCPDTYVVTPWLSNYCFSSQSVTVGSAQTTNGVDFVATPGAYHVSGTLRYMPAGPPVSVSIVGANTTNVVTTATGTYTFPSLCPGTYVVTPSNTCYQFYPPSNSTTVGPNDDSLDFDVSGGGAYAIRGQVTQGGAGVSNVTVSAAGQTYVTGADGNYAFSYVCLGGSPVTVTPSLGGYAFVPAAQSLTLTSNVTGLNFMAFPSLALTRATDGSFQVAFATAFTCGVEASTDLKTWQAIFVTNTVSSNTLVMQFADTNGATLPRRFFRLGETFAGVPFLTNWAVASRTASLDGVAFPIQDCQIEVSTDLKNWTPAFTNNFPTNGAPFQFRFSQGTTNSPTRFYRVFQTPGF